MIITDRTTQWGIAWVALALAIGLHVADEAMTDFLPLYNSMVGSLRHVHPWILLPTFDFNVWLTGLIAGVLLLLSVSPLVFAGTRIFRPISYLLGVVMALNALGHIGGSMYLRALAPGVVSSPILLVAAIALLLATNRAR